MRYAPAYSAERFPGDFAVSVLCAAITAVLLGPGIWWFARMYLIRTYPHHPELLGAAIVTGAMDGVLIAALSFVACFAMRIWRYERQERKQSDNALRVELERIATDLQHTRGEHGEPFPPRG